MDIFKTFKQLNQMIFGKSTEETIDDLHRSRAELEVQTHRISAELSLMDRQVCLFLERNMQEEARDVLRRRLTLSNRLTSLNQQLQFVQQASDVIIQGKIVKDIEPVLRGAARTVRSLSINQYKMSDSIQKIGQASLELEQLGGLFDGAMASQYSEDEIDSKLKDYQRTSRVSEPGQRIEEVPDKTSLVEFESMFPSVAELGSSHPANGAMKQFEPVPKTDDLQAKESSSKHLDLLAKQLL